jgi:hypothetical protein
VHVPRVLLAAAVGLLLGGCTSSDVTLESRPTDADSAQDLAELVAEKAECGSFEYYDDTKDQWVFTCQSGDASYDIRVVPDEDARRAVLQLTGASSPVKAGAYFLVQAAARADGQPSGALDRFPGEVQRAAG